MISGAEFEEALPGSSPRAVFHRVTTLGPFALGVAAVAM